MFKIFKKLTLKGLISLKKEKWSNDTKYKVLIQVNSNLSKSKWMQFINSNIADKVINELEILFCDSRFEFIKNFDKANACFMLSSGNHLPVNSHKKLIYYPLQGIDSVNQDLMKNHIFKTPPPKSSYAIAEYCLSMSILAIRRIHYSVRNQYFRKWHQSKLVNRLYKPLNKHIIGVLGYGKIGQKITALFSSHGCDVCVCDNKNVSIDNITYFPSVKLDEFLKAIDILIISLPLNKENTNIINESRFSILKDKIIVNVSRGGIIDEKALKKSLKNNINQIVVSDVFKDEPLPFLSNLWGITNLIITPHIAGNINLFFDEIQSDFFSQVQKYYSHE
jgi:phosphoglycerate dehydrogenase-like enzyme